MKYLVLICTMLTLCACTVKTEEPTLKTDSPTLEWNLRLMKREFPEGTKDFFNSDFNDYLKHRKDFKEFVGLTIYTEGFKSSKTNASFEIGNFTFSVILHNDGEIDMITVFGGFQKKGKSIITPRVKCEKSKSEIENNFGKEIILTSFSKATHDKNNPDRYLNIEARVWVLLVNKINSDIEKLAKDSLPIPDPPFFRAKEIPPEQKEFLPSRPKKEKQSDQKEIPPDPARKKKQPGP